ncbi:MAG: AAC(3) family N-acetyltransferase [Candidatus Omnitrophota bacterium]|nr:MAG: AAC(3) family N-acetyltransferase [Candidatus Omnitrophota bacterium]
MPFPKVTKKDIVDKLEKLKVRRGDDIYVASFTPILGREPNILEHTIDALIEIVGASGTVVMPTFNWDYCRGEIFNPETTPSQVGVLTEIFRKRPGVLRSLTPPWCTFAAIGKYAKDIVNVRGTSPFGIDSIAQFLYEINVKYVLLGCPYKDAVIHTHWLEEKYEVPYRYWKQFKGKVMTNGKTITDVSYMYARNLEINADIDPGHLTELFDRTDKVKIERLGLGKVRSFRAKDYCDFMIPYFEKDKLAILKPEIKKYFDEYGKYKFAE